MLCVVNTFQRYFCSNDEFIFVKYKEGKMELRKYVHPTLECTAQFAGAASVVSKDLDIFKIEAVSVNHVL
jgi:hypothetical protein